VVQALFIHQNFPGQYYHLAAEIARRPNARVVAIGERDNPVPVGVEYLRYRPPAGSGEKTHSYLRATEAGVRRGQRVAEACHSLKQRGFRPDIICCHPGWGEGLYLRDVFPDAQLLQYCEFYYRAQGADVGFDLARPVTLDDAARVRTLNMVQLVSLEAANWGVSPTLWQRSSYPSMITDRISVVHEGVDSAFSTPDGPTDFSLADGRVLRRGDEVISFVARNLEPYRGFDIFMRALPQILARRRSAQAVIVGSDEQGYGRLPADGRSWKAMLVGELGDRLDPSRVHFCGHVPHTQLQTLFRLAAAHVYFSYPFVLSWSLIEAMGCGALILGSATAPVQEVIRHGESGLLLPFHDVDRLADAVVHALEAPYLHAPLRAGARRTMRERFDLRGVCLPRQVALFDAIAARRAGSKTVAVPAL
jgi:glycosyltransferase involved in cell wall biosynthesis